MTLQTEKQKHCSRLWNGLVIRHNGNVFPCCQLGTNPERAIGNIHDQSLAQIMNNEKIKKMRRQSLDSALPCYDTCDQVKYYEAYPLQRPCSVETDLKWFADLQVEYGEICNADCIMCWQDRNNRTMLSFEKLKENLPLDSWKNINLYGGEVFVMKGALQFLYHLFERGKKVMITTNGKALSNLEIMEKVVRSCCAIIISINAVTEKTHTQVMRPKRPFFYQVLENVKNMRKLRDDLKKPYFKILGHFTVVKESLEEFPDFITRFQDMGFDQATIGLDHRHFPDFLRENPDILTHLRLKVHHAFSNCHDTTKLTLTQRDLFLV